MIAHLQHMNDTKEPPRNLHNLITKQCVIGHVAQWLLESACNFITKALRKNSLCSRENLIR